MELEPLQGAVLETPALASEEDIATAQRFNYRQLAEVVVAEWLGGISSPNTADAYRRDMHRFGDWLDTHRGGKAIDAVDVADARLYSKYLEEAGEKRKTRHRRISTLSTLFDYLLAAGAVPVNPFHHKLVPRPKARTADTPTRWAGPEDIVRVLEEASHPSRGKSGVRDLFILALAISCGLRADEMCSLSMGDVREGPQGCSLRVVGKGGRVDHVGLDQDVCDALAEWLEAREEVLQAAGVDPEDPAGPLLCTVQPWGKAGPGHHPAGSRLTRQALSAMVRRTSKKALGFELTAHSMRKSAAIFMHKSGSTLDQLRRWGRWESQETISTYVNVDSDEDHPGAGMLERMRSARTGQGKQSRMGHLRRRGTDGRNRQ